MQTVIPIYEAIHHRYPHRERQIQQTAIFLAPDLPSPPALILHGLPSTGKTTILRSVLSHVPSPSTIISCRECITTRQLLEHTTADVLEALIAHQQDETNPANGDDDPSLDASYYTRTENAAALAVHLERLLAHRNDKFILAFDAVDALKENSSALLPALVRIAESLQNLTIVFTLTTPAPNLFRRPGLPHIHFSAYTREEAISIISATPLSLDSSIDASEDDAAWLWTHFATAVWDSLASIASNDIPAFQHLCHKLWTPFTSPLKDGKCKPREFSRLMILNRALFQSDDALLDDFAAPSLTNNTSDSIPPFQTYILIATYLASHNPPRTDTIYFSEWSERRKKKRRRVSKPQRSSTAATKTAHRQISRRHLPASAFTLPRLWAILSAIYPHPVNSAQHPGAVPEVWYADVMSAIASLCSARLLVRTGGGGDPMDEGARWRSEVSWEMLVGLGRGVGVEVADYVAD
ncbi:MAG: hypothetical protein Q9162_002928 [Coniocarpon cinnabarinum]